MLDLKQMNDETTKIWLEFQTTARWSSPNIWEQKCEGVDPLRCCPRLV